MPSIELTTNVQVPDPKALTLHLAQFGADLLDKPLEYISTHYIYNDTLTFGGNHDPAFIMRIVSLGNISHKKNEEYSEKLSKWLKDNLKLKDDRGYIVFEDPGNSNIGYNGTTFGTIFGKK